GLTVLLLGSIIAVPGLAIATAPAVFVAEAENSIEADAAAIGATLDVTCPANPPVLFEQGFTCEGLRPDGSVLDIEVSLQRVNGWAAWRVDGWGIFTIGQLQRWPRRGRNGLRGLSRARSLDCGHRRRLGRTP